jgi:glycine/D-amino acid oxidase-like deaminating enzyme
MTRQHPDVVVVGAGIVGCGTALELARAGLRVLVVDRNGVPGHGSTSASSAIVRFTYSHEPAVSLAWEAAQRWSRWRELLGAPADEPVARLHRIGAGRLDSAAVPARLLDLFERVGIPYEIWESGELRERVPGIDTGSFGPPCRPDHDAFWAEADGEVSMLFTPDGGYVDDPQLAAQNLAAAALRAGVEIRHRTVVTGVDRTGGRVSGVRLADGGTISTPVVVNAAGPWSTGLNRIADVGHDFGIRVRPMRAEVHRISAPASLAGGDGALFPFADLDLGTYVRPDSGGGMLVGGIEPECDPLEWIDDPDAANPKVSAAQFELQVLRAARRFPDVAVPTRPQGISGVYDVAEDWAPVYDRTELPGFYVAMGTSGNQFKNAPVIGELVAAIVLASENGRDHDRDPVRLRTSDTGASLDLSAFSRLRTIGADSARSVSG